MHEFKCNKCGNIEIFVRERYENQETQKLKPLSGKVFEHVASEDVVYECACDKCNNYFEINGERREYGRYSNEGGIYLVVE